MSILVRNLGLVEYAPCWQAMRDFTVARDARTADQCWVVQHPSVFTLGRAGKREHLLCPGDIPVVETDRGGQVTYHGPGQLLVYILLDLRRQHIGPRELVRRIEQSVIDYLSRHAILAERHSGAPGVYVAGEKIAALGLRVAGGCSYHGVALNVSMDLEPFTRINPCGYAGLTVTDLARQGGPRDISRVRDDYLPLLAAALYGDQPVVLDYATAADTLPSTIVREVVN